MNPKKTRPTRHTGQTLRTSSLALRLLASGTAGAGATDTCGGAITLRCHNTAQFLRRHDHEKSASRRIELHKAMTARRNRRKTA